ncbi:hypothetical protein QQ045_010230 [Rhodiola kirilowii]
MATGGLGGRWFGWMWRRNVADNRHLISESDLAKGATSWVSLAGSDNIKSAKQRVFKECGSIKKDQKKLKGIGGPSSALSDGEVCSSEKVLNISNSEQSDSQNLSEKYMNILKKVKRREAIAKKNIRYQRRKHLRSLGNDQEPIEGVTPLQQPSEGAIVVRKSQEGSYGTGEGHQEERSSDHFEITLSAFKVMKRKESKEKKAIKDQRSSCKDRLKGLKSSYIKELVRSKESSRTILKVKAADEERRKLEQRKAAVESLGVVRRVGMRFLGTEEEGIQFFINEDEERRKERDQVKV